MKGSFDGIGVTPRAGVGTAVWYQSDFDLPEETTADPETERSRYETARGQAHAELETEQEHAADTIGEEEAAVFDAHSKFLDDPQLVDAATELIDAGRPAERAVQEAFADPIAQFEGMDGRMAERADDLRDLRDRLLRLLLDADRTDLAQLPADSVVLAQRLTPSDTAQLDPDSIAGFATVEGGRTSHAAIMARSLDIPAVVGVGEPLEEISDGAAVLVDGDDDRVVLEPSAEAKAEIEDSSTVPVQLEPVSTDDDRRIEVAANVGSTAELSMAADRGADGIGLFRTEFLFLDRDSPPSEQEQYEAFCDALETFDGGRVVVRTFDIGGDKPIPYLDRAEGSNPFLGVRGLRLARQEPALFETQLRALLRAAASKHGDALAVMFPLVAAVDELTDALDRLDAVASDLDDEDVDYDYPELGVMVETPAAVFTADELARHVSFLSIGTNDLTQYVMAAARDDERLADLHDPLHPAVLRAISRVVDAAHENDAWAGMCGEMAGNPAVTELLVGLGLDELSMSATTIPTVKATIQDTTYKSADALTRRVLAADTKREVLALLRHQT